MTFRLLITDGLSPDAVALLDAQEDIEYEVMRDLAPEELADRVVGYHGLVLRSTTSATAAVIEGADVLQVIGRAGVGVDNIDLRAASERGVIVMNTPGANTTAAAEHTVAMLLAACRKIPQAVASLRDGRWDRKPFRGIELRAKTLGIVGMGRVGRRVADRCRAFGMEVICCDPYLSDDRAYELHVARVDLDELLERSDVISLHAALTPKTRGIIGEAALAKVKPGVLIVNAARGGLIDEAALIPALRSGRVGGAALDVLAEEPPAFNNPLLQMDNVIVTPHLASSTEEAQREVGVQIVRQVIDALRGTDFRNAVNMPVVDRHIQRELQPYLALAERLGRLQAQLADEAITKVEVAVEGEIIDDQIKPLTVAILKGLLEPVPTGAINYVNAPHIAMDRGIVVAQTTGLHTTDYPNIISCRVEWNGGRRSAAVSLFSHDEPRIVDMDGLRIDVIPEGIILVTVSHDEPGFIGKVGTMLGELGINIATWRTGRSAPGGQAVSFISVDSDVPDEIIAELAKTAPIERITKVRL